MARVDLKVKGGGPLRCAYCHDSVNADERSACADCLAVHHAACWREGGSCASCRSERALMSVEEILGEPLEAEADEGSNADEDSNPDEAEDADDAGDADEAEDGDEAEDVADPPGVLASLSARARAVLTGLTAGLLTTIAVCCGLGIVVVIANAPGHEGVSVWLTMLLASAAALLIRTAWWLVG